MSNRYEQPIASEFINTYVPIPFKEIQAAGQMKQERYDRGAAAQDAVIQNLESLEAVPGSPDELFKKEQLRRMYEIRDKYSDKDLSDSFVIRQMNNDIRLGIDKERIKDMLTNVQNWKRYEAQRVKLGEEGTYNPLLDKHDVSKYDSSKGVYNYALSAYTPKEQTLDKYFDEIRDPSYKNTIQNEKDINYGMQMYSTDDADVARVVGARANEYASTLSGQHEIQLRKDQMKVQGIDTSEISDISIAKDIMTEVGQRYKRSEMRGVRAPQTLRDSGRGDSGGIQLPAMTTPIESKDSIPGKNDRQKQAYLEKEHQNALLVVQTAPEGSDERVKAQGIIDRNNRVKDLVTKRVEKQVSIADANIKDQTFKKLRALSAYKNMSDAEIQDVINTQLGDGLVSSLHRFGTSIDNAQDQTAYGVSKATEFVVNLFKATNTPLNPVRMKNAVDNALGELDSTKPFTFGDIFKVAYNTAKHMYSDNKFKAMSNQVAKEAAQDDLNILRELSLTLNRRESKVKDEFSKQYLDELQHIDQLQAFFPITTTKDSSTDIEYVTDNTGKKIAPSYTHQFIKGIPSIIDELEIKTKSGDKGYVVMNKKQKNEAIGEFSTWDVVNRLTYTGVDKDGNIIIHFGLASKNTDSKSGLKTSGEYEVKVPANSSIGRGIVNDRVLAGQDEAAIKLGSSELVRELGIHINDKNGHEYNIQHNPSIPKPIVKVEPDPTSGKYLIQLNGEYLKDEKGNPIPLTENEVSGQLLQIQYQALKRR